MTTDEYLKAVEDAAKDWTEQYKKFNERRVALKELAMQHAKYKKKDGSGKRTPTWCAVADICRWCQEWDEEMLLRIYIRHYIEMRNNERK